ncbi:hypothetical protein ACXYMT_06975 [Salinimicrobium sp. CAU 1759]
MPELKNLKLIWDFKGPDGEHTAAHHAIHLQEYAEKHNLYHKISNSEKLTETHFIAFLVVTEAEMPAVRDALKPHRGQIYNLQEEK